MPTTITEVRGYRVWDSRGRPTVETEIKLSDGTTAKGIAPAGASRGKHEAIELRDGGELLGGQDVSQAINGINTEINEALFGIDVLEQTKIDQILVDLDGTSNRKRLGGNAIVATSMAVLFSAAASEKLPLWKYLSQGKPVRLPLPEVQIFGGGAHAGRRTDIQDFMVMPVGAESFDQAMVICAEVYRAAGQIMKERGSLYGVADEGGWWPDFESNEQALEILAFAIDRAGYSNGEAVISLDLAASEFYQNPYYKIALDSRQYTSDEWVEKVVQWVERYPILSIEDPVGEDDVAGMRKITAAIGDKVQIIGDDYLVTKSSRVKQAISDKCCNAVLIKPNQAGTISEALEALLSAKKVNWGTIVSARSGETEDVIISHLAVGWDAGQLKVGSFSRSERMAKWNECLRIEREGKTSGFAGLGALPVTKR